MKSDLRDIWQAETRADAGAAMDVFAEKYGPKYEKAVTCLTKDREALLAFYDFPAEHWDHLRTANPIESVFATVRHRTVRTKGALSQKTARLMVYKLIQAAAKGWRRLKGANQLPMVIDRTACERRRRSAGTRPPRRPLRPGHRSPEPLRLALRLGNHPLNLAQLLRCQAGEQTFEFGRVEAWQGGSPRMPGALKVTLLRRRNKVGTNTIC